jgi:hypothetical protein
MRNFLLLIIIIISSCKSEKKLLTAQKIIDKTIVFSGADKVSNAKISLKFRDKDYAAIRKNGEFKLFRGTKKDSISVNEVLTNNSYKRLINTQSVKVADSMITKYSNSINSVHYFSVLPFGLNDKAVQKKLLASSTINEKEYYKVEITFSEYGGGEDF